MIGINTEEKLVTVATFNKTYFQADQFIRFTDVSEVVNAPTIAVIQKVRTKKMTLQTITGIKYEITAEDVFAGLYVIEKVTITIEGGI
jgi:hypothetical protein